MDWLALLAVQGTLKSSPTPQFKSIDSSALSFLYSPTHIHIWLLEKPNRCFHILSQTESNLDGLHCTLHKAHSFLVGTTSCGPLLPILTLCLLITNSDCCGLFSGPWSPRPHSAIAFSDLCFLLHADGFSPTLHWNSARVSGFRESFLLGLFISDTSSKTQSCLQQDFGNRSLEITH